MNFKNNYTAFVLQLIQNRLSSVTAPKDWDAIGHQPSSASHQDQQALTAQPRITTVNIWIRVQSWGQGCAGCKGTFHPIRVSDHEQWTNPRNHPALSALYSGNMKSQKEAIQN